MKRLGMGGEANEKIIDILKWGMLPWVAGKGPGDAPTEGIKASIDLVERFQMIPENPMLIDGSHIMTGDHVIITIHSNRPPAKLRLSLGDS
jgi:hypothetical protein